METSCLWSLFKGQKRERLVVHMINKRDEIKIIPRGMNALKSSKSEKVVKVELLMRKGYKLISWLQEGKGLTRHLLAEYNCRFHWLQAFFNQP